MHVDMRNGWGRHLEQTADFRQPTQVGKQSLNRLWCTCPGSSIIAQNLLDEDRSVTIRPPALTGLGASPGDRCKVQGTFVHTKHNPIDLADNPQYRLPLGSRHTDTALTSSGGLAHIMHSIPAPLMTTTSTTQFMYLSPPWCGDTRLSVFHHHHHHHHHHPYVLSDAHSYALASGPRRAMLSAFPHSTTL